MKEFKTYHPAVNFIYFVFVTVFSCFFTHPAALAISMICGFTYSVMMNGRKNLKTNLMYMLPLMFATALINPLFNHEGVTVLGYFPNGNPFTLESAAYGMGAAAMLIGVICWFSCCNGIMTSDKFIYLFGRIIPSLSLVLSMTLRFVPKFSEELKNIADAQRCLGRDMSSGGIIKRAKCGLTVLSSMITLSLENSAETACSMKSRGYGLPGRTAYSIFRFDKRDKAALAYIALFGIYTLVGGICGGMYFSWFPSMKSVEISLFSLSVFVSYSALCVFPIIIEIKETAKWKAIESKI